MRAKGLSFIPTSINLSDFEGHLVKNEIGHIEDKEREIEIDKEILLLKALATLSSDKERCILLLEILREYGFQIDYGSMSRALGINLRWFMRVKQAMRQKVRVITINE